MWHTVAQKPKIHSDSPKVTQSGSSELLSSLRAEFDHLGYVGFSARQDLKNKLLGDPIGAVSTGEYQRRLGGPNSTSSAADIEIELKEGWVFI